MSLTHYEKEKRHFSGGKLDSEYPDGLADPIMIDLVVGAGSEETTEAVNNETGRYATVSDQAYSWSAGHADADWSSLMSIYDYSATATHGSAAMRHVGPLAAPCLVGSDPPEPSEARTTSPPARQHCRYAYAGFGETAASASLPAGRSLSELR
jgi:hypothetical protein